MSTTCTQTIVSIEEEAKTTVFEDEKVQDETMSSPRDFFLKIDQQHSSLLSQLNNCEQKRQAIVREMADHVLSFHSHPSVFQRHAELATQLPELQKEHDKLSKKLATFQLLSDRRKDIELRMIQRLNMIGNGNGHPNLSTHELRRLVENEASASIQLEILNSERINTWKLQLKKSKKEIVHLKFECSMKDERIKLLEQKVDYLQQQLTGGGTRLEESKSSVYSSDDASWTSEESFLHDSRPDPHSCNIKPSNGHLYLSSPPLPMQTLSHHNFQKPTNNATASTTKPRASFSQHSSASQSVTVKMAKNLSEPSLDPVVMIANEDAIRKEQEKCLRYRMRAEAAKAALDASRKSDGSGTLSERQLPSPGSHVSSLSLGSTHRHPRQAAQMPPLSPTSSFRSAGVSLKESFHSSNDVLPPMLPGALRMSAHGELLDESDQVNQDDDDTENDSRPTPPDFSTMAITATLVREQSVGSAAREKERSFTRRERELEEREAQIAEQAQRLRDITTAQVAAVPTPAFATAVATVSRQGSIRELGRAVSSISDVSASVSLVEEGSSSLTMGTIGEGIVTPDLEAGPLRFHPLMERSLRLQLRDLSDEDYECFRALQSRWERKRKDKGAAPYSVGTILRFLRNNCSSNGSFCLKKAWKAMKNCKERNLFLSACKLEKQLLTATLFPIPGLLSHAGLEMFYMKPSRYHRKDSVNDIIDNLVYVMNCMLEKEQNSENGIGFLACMNDWKMVNFDTTYCYKFMMALQAAVVPVSIELFLIVNPPSWFGKVWNVMRPMLAPSFRKKVKVIKESMLDVYLKEGYREYLPDDLSTGTVNTFQLAQDFVTYRKYMEKDNFHLKAKSADEDSASQVSGTSRHSFVNWVGHHHHDISHKSLDSSRRHHWSSDTDNLGSSIHELESSFGHDDNDDDGDASIHCSIHGDEEESSGIVDS